MSAATPPPVTAGGLLLALLIGCVALSGLTLAAVLLIVRDHLRATPCDRTINLGLALGGRKRCDRRGPHLIHETHGVKWADERGHLEAQR